jgi:hypothetical protein
MHWAVIAFSTVLLLICLWWTAVYLLRRAGIRLVGKADSRDNKDGRPLEDAADPRESAESGS